MNKWCYFFSTLYVCIKLIFNNHLQYFKTLKTSYKHDYFFITIYTKPNSLSSHLIVCYFCIFHANILQRFGLKFLFVILFLWFWYLSTDLILNVFFFFFFRFHFGIWIDFPATNELNRCSVSRVVAVGLWVFHTLELLASLLEFPFTFT